MYEAMLVPVVEFVQQPEMRLPTAVRLQTLDDCLNTWSRATDLLLATGEVFGGTADREGDLLFVRLRPTGRGRESHKLVRQMVKRRAQVVQAITDEDAEERVGMADLSDLEDVLAGVRIVLLRERIKCSFDERVLGLLEGSEVTARSFDLEFDPFKSVHELTSP